MTAKAAKREAETTLSDEDRAAKEAIEHIVERLCAEPALDEQRRYAQQLMTRIVARPTSRAAAPKELRFLSPLYEQLVAHFAALADSPARRQLAEALAYASIALSKNYDRDALRYFRQGTGERDPATLGGEFVLGLAADVAAEYEHVIVAGEGMEELVDMAKRLAVALFAQGDDIAAVDMLLEIERLDLLEPHIDDENCPRICAYLMSYLEYCADAVEFDAVLNSVYRFAYARKDARTAMLVALRQNSKQNVLSALCLSTDRGVVRQLGFMLARHRFYITTEELGAANVAVDSLFLDAMSNTLLAKFVGKLLNELELTAPKRVEEIYRDTFGERDREFDSALGNLGDSFASALVNLGSGREALLQSAEEGAVPWLQRVRDSGVMSTVASLGLIHLWNFEEAQGVLADYIDLHDGWARAGACIAVGLANSGVWSEADPAKALLIDALGAAEPAVKLGAVVGFGLAYAGTGRADLDPSLMAIANDEGQGVELCANAALALAAIHAAECNAETAECILTSLTLFAKENLDRPIAGLFAFALGIACLGAQAQAEPVIEAVRATQASSPALAAVAELIVDAAAYVASGNVLKLQAFIARVKQPAIDDAALDAQATALLGVALIAISEPTGTAMALRLVHHVLQYSPPRLRRAVPIMLFVLGAVGPSLQIGELLYKLGFEEDRELALRAILALGLVFCGTNNARAGDLLRNLAGYYGRESAFVFISKLALGFVFAGKGVVGLAPFYCDRFLHSKTAFAGLLVTAFLLTHVEELLLKDAHYLLFYLSLAITPKMLFCLDEQFEDLRVSLRVGKAVETVAQPGKPRRITGFQTYTSPVVVNAGERPELATEEYLPALDNYTENFLIIRKNPDFDPSKQH